MNDADHEYLSTSCLHGYHGYCSSDTGSNGTTIWDKTPGTCKFCGALCICPCHQETPHVSITLAIPENPADATFLVDCAVDYAEETLRETGQLNAGTLLSSSLLTMLIKKRGRRIGAISLVTGAAPDGTLRTEVDTRYLVPRWRRKGLSRPLFAELQVRSEYPVHLRRAVHPASIKAADALGITYCTDTEDPQLDTITALVLNAVDCNHDGERPCRNCVVELLRDHFSKQCAQMIATTLGVPV